MICSRMSQKGRSIYSIPIMGKACTTLQAETTNEKVEDFSCILGTEVPVEPTDDILDTVGLSSTTGSASD